MEKLLKYLMFIFVAIFVASCGGDEKDEPENPNNPNPGTFYEVRTETSGLYTEITFTFTDEDGETFPALNLWFDENELHTHIDRYCWANCKIADYGKVSSLSIISKLNNLKWLSADCSLPLAEGNGYVAEGSRSGKPYYLRFYIKSIVKSASGTVVGVEVQSQQFIPAN